MGTSKVREALERGAGVAEILSSLETGLSAFIEQRKPYLLYD